MPLAPRLLGRRGKPSPAYSPLGYTRLWGLTDKNGSVSGTAASDTGLFMVRWWDQSVDIYNNGSTFTKSGSGSRVFEVYPVAAYVVDDSGGSRDATLFGNAQISTTNSQSGFGPSALLDGSGDYFYVGKGSDFQFWGSEDWTIEMWVRPTNVGVYAPLFLSGSRLNLHMYFNNTLYLNDATTGAGGLVISGALTANAWQHVAAVRQGNTSSVYVNGVRVGTGAVPYGTGSGNLEIGGSPAQSAYMYGNLDEVRVVRGSALYSGASFTPPSAPLSLVSGTVLLLHFDSTQSSPGGQFDAFNVSSNGLTKLRAESVSLSSAPGSYQYGSSVWSNSTYTWVPGAYVPGTPEQGNLSNNSLNAAALNQFYTDLLGGSGALYVAGNPGIAADDPTIATAKGYTVFGSVPPATSLLLNFNGGNGSTTFTDSSDNALTVTGNGGAQLSTSQSKFGGSSLYLSGSSYLTLTHPALGLDDFTIETWARVDQSQNDNQYVFDLGTNGGMLQVLNDYGFQGPVFLGNADYGVRNTGGQTSINSNQWYHFAVVRQSGTTTLYIDGVSAGSFSDPSNYTSTSMSIGRYGGGGLGLYGYLDDFRIISRKALYTANFTPPASQLGVLYF